MNKALDENEESRSGMCRNVEISLEGKKTLLLSGGGAENGQILPNYQKIEMRWQKLDQCTQWCARLGRYGLT